MYDIVRALADGTAPPQEGRVAMAMTREGELKGFRHAEETSGLTDDTLLKILPEAGASTALLSCTNRGKFALEPEDRRPMALHLRPYRSSAGHPSSPSSNSFKDQGIKGSKELEDVEDVEEEPHGVRQMSKDVLDLLDPSLDIWNNATAGSHERQEFGDAGWALAVVTGLRATTFALDEICKITRVGERQARRIIDKLEHWGWARRIREGRRVLIIVDFSMMAHEDLRDDYLKHQRKARKGLIHQREGGVIKRLGTKIAWDVKEMWASRASVVKMFEDWIEVVGTCAHWERLMKILRRRSCKEDRRKGLGRWEAEEQLYQELKPYYPAMDV